MSKNSVEETAEQKEIMIQALEANYGNITRAAKATNIAASTHYRWMKDDPDYEKRADISKDVGYRAIKDNIIDIALDKARKGNVPVLNKLMGIFLKNLPEEMKALHRNNDVPMRVGIKYVDKPAGWDESIREMEERAKARNQGM